MILFLPSFVDYYVNDFLNNFVGKRNSGVLRYYQDNKMPDYESAKNSVCIVENSDMLLDDNTVKTILDLFYRNAPDKIYSYILLPDASHIDYIKQIEGKDIQKSVDELENKEFKHFELIKIYSNSRDRKIYSILRDYRINKFNEKPAVVETLRILFSDPKLPRDFNDKNELFIEPKEVKNELNEVKATSAKSKYLSMEKDNPYRESEAIWRLFGPIYNINFKDLVERQKYVWMRYESPKTYNLKNVSATEFIRELDKYLFNIIEEISEAIDVKAKFDDNNYELRESFDKNELIEEIIDVFNYSATTLSILVTSYRYFKEDVPVNVLLNETFFKVKLMGSDVIDYNDDCMNKDFITILSNVISVRRLFGERKWHKPHPIATEEANISRVLTSIYHIANAIKTAGRILLYLVQDHREINEMINRKFCFIVDLPDVKQDDENTSDESEETVETINIEVTEPLPESIEIECKLSDED